MKTDLSIRAAIYLRAAELVEQGHCKGVLAKLCGKKCDTEVGDSFCYHGALIKASIEITGKRHSYSSENNWDNCPTMKEAFWNDLPSTTKEMVAAKLREQAFAEEA